MTDSHDDDERKPQNYITLDGWRKVTAELDQLLREERPKVVTAVTEAAAMGDRSENADYIYGKKRLREIDKRLNFLQARLDKLKVVDPRENWGKTQVFFGATVVIEDENGKRATYQIVGEDEIDAKGGRISVNGPMGRTLLKKHKGDVVVVVRPAGEVEVTIKEVRYG